MDNPFGNEGSQWTHHSDTFRSGNVIISERPGKEQNINKKFFDIVN